MAKRTTAHSTARRAWITGASTGIGAAFARRLARDGWHLTVVARDRERLESLAAELHHAHGIEVTVRAADLTDAAARARIERGLADDERLELLVNNAGYGTAGAFATLDPEREEAEIDLNVVALVRLTRAALPGLLRRRRGAVLNVSSLAAFQPGPHSATYAATKAFVNSFTEALHEELRGSGVLAMALCPGFTRTEFQARAEIDTSAIPAAAWMSAEAVVDAALRGLARGDAVCVPGAANWVVSNLVSALPRGLVRRAIGLGAKRMFDK
ncbi:MAG: SDR family oxidoreductase [Deltaproteobacteria bacterium]|nr:SDR family oxidoreductase [Deltaproteobacteria bacterium]